jgi:hypothetical protein
VYSVGKEHGMGTMMERGLRMLATQRAFRVLLVLNVLMVFFLMWSTRGVVLSDTWSYVGLAEGILHGEYSMWWPLEADYPDTFRTPGFPLMIAVVMFVFGTWKAMVWVNFVLYWVALYLTLRTIGRYDPRPLTRNLFLLLLLPMINVPYYINQVYTEIPTLVAISLFLFVVMRPGKWTVGGSAALGLLFGFMFQCKPVFLIFPTLFAVAAFLMDRKNFDVRGQMVMLFTFVVTLLPYGYWNLRNHGVFKVTQLEGGGGYMHFSYWCGKMPGYTDHISLGNFTGDEIIRFTPEDSVPKHIAAFEEEWAEIKSRIDPLLTAKDSVMVASRADMPYIPHMTFNSEFTLMREKILQRQGLEHMWNDPWYTLAYKSYSAVRLWVIGIQRGDFQRASIAGKVQMLYATGITGLVFLLSLALIPLAYERGRLSWASTWPLVFALVYVGFFHLPFTIQARYTTCVRFAMLALLAMAIAGLTQGRATPDRVDAKLP